MGTRVAGTVTEVEFTVGACEPRTAAAHAVGTTVQALAPCGYTWVLSEQSPGSPPRGSTPAQILPRRVLYQELGDLGPEFFSELTYKNH